MTIDESELDQRIDELYALQDEVNEEARAYSVGSGDRLGRHTSRVAQTMTAAVAD